MKKEQFIDGVPELLPLHYITFDKFKYNEDLPEEIVSENLDKKCFNFL